VKDIVNEIHHTNTILQVKPPEVSEARSCV